jgi:hypothetical protein
MGTQQEVATGSAEAVKTDGIWSDPSVILSAGATN